MTEKAKIERVECAIEPVFDSRSRVLMLGTMPSPKSREVGFFYGNPQNRFWRVMAAVLGEPTPGSIPEKREMLLRHGVALWDVLASCDIVGASDASIKNPVPSDLSRVLDVADVKAIFCTGAKSAELYKKFQEPKTGIPCVKLPSTSPANASKSLPDLVEAYSAALRPHLA